MKLIDADAEIQAIFSILTSYNDVKIELLNRLNSSYFGYDPMCLAFEIITNLTKKALTLPSGETFLSTPEVSEEIKMLLTKATNCAVTTKDDTKHLINILDYYRKARLIYEFSSVAVTQLRGVEIADLEPIINKMESSLMNMRIANEDSRMSHFGLGAPESDKYINSMVRKEVKSLIPSTFANFDKQVGGFGHSFLVFFASHAKGGKSTVALNMLVNQYLLHNLDVIYVSLEMTEEEVRDCISSKISGVEHGNIRKGVLTDAEIKNIQEAWKTFNDHGKANNCRFTIWCPSTISAVELRVNLKPLNYTVVCVDYINLMTTTEKGLALHEKLNTLGRELKQVAKDLNVLLVVPAQMNPDGDVRYSKSMREHANDIWAWFYGEEEKSTGQITVKELVSRGWGDFSFKLDVDFAHKTVSDGAETFIEDSASAARTLESMC